MIGYELPSSVSVGGADYPIRTDFRAVLDALDVTSDAEFDGFERLRTEAFLNVMFPDWKAIPTEHLEEAIKKAIEFIDCGQRDDGKPHPRLVDWEQDAAIIMPAINSVAHIEVRSLPYVHWWTFFGYYMSIGESLFSSVLNVRIKKSKHKKLEKWEEEFYRDNRDIIDLKRESLKRSDEEKQALKELLGM